MEEELNYATLELKNKGGPSKVTNEDSTIYSVVKSEKRTANTIPNGEAAARCHHFRLLVLCLGILCVLILVSISTIIYMRMLINEQKANSEAKLSNVTAEYQQLIMESSILQKKMYNLNWTLGVIMKFNTFPVNDYCPNKVCQPCKNGWIQFQEKCYLFYNQDAPWYTWTNSLQYCRNATADLVVINSLQEQEFISNHSQYYYDMYHGYWLGLNQTAGKYWRWVDGGNDTLRYWMTEQLGTTGPCALMIPGRNHTANWEPADCAMQNKFICETEVLIRSNYLA